MEGRNFLFLQPLGLFWPNHLNNLKMFPRQTRAILCGPDMKKLGKWVGVPFLPLCCRGGFTKGEPGKSQATAVNTMTLISQQKPQLGQN